MPPAPGTRGGSKICTRVCSAEQSILLNLRFFLHNKGLLFQGLEVIYLIVKLCGQDANVSFVHSVTVSAPGPFTITIHPSSLPKSGDSLLLSWDWGFSHSLLFCRISHARKKSRTGKAYRNFEVHVIKRRLLPDNWRYLIASTSNGYKVELIIRSPSHRYNSVWSTSQSEDWDHDQPDPLGSQTTTPSNGLNGRELKCTSLSTAPDSAAFEIALISWFQDMSRSPSWLRGPFHKLNPTSCCCSRDSKTAPNCDDEETLSLAPGWPRGRRGSKWKRHRFLFD